MIKLFLIILFCSLTSPCWAAFNYYRTITVDHSKVSTSDQTQFPILVCGNGSSPCNTPISGMNQTGAGAHVQNSNGYDIVFGTNSSCSSLLTWEMETYNASTGEFVAWVTNTAVPLSHTVDTTFYMCYGNPVISTFQSTASSVWDSNYKAVWHLPNGTSLSANDSTIGAHTGTLINSPPATTGQIDGAAAISGTSNANMKNITTATSSSYNVTNGTWSAWVSTTASSTGPIMDRDNFSTNRSWQFRLSSSGNVELILFSGGSFTAFTSTGTVNNGTKHYVGATYDGSNVKIYIDGSVDKTTAYTSSMNSVTLGLWIGANIGDAGFRQWFNGTIDDPRFSGIGRASEWINTEYNNQSSPSTFYSVGSETAISSSHLHYITGGSYISGSSLLN